MKSRVTLNGEMGLYCQSDSLKLKTAGTYPSPLDLQSSSSANLPSTQLLSTSFILRLFFTTVQSNYDAHKEYFSYARSSKTLRLVFIAMATPGAGAGAGRSPSLRSR